MKKIFYVLFAVVISIALTTCTEDSKVDRKTKKEVKKYLQENLKDPDSLKDLVITYAPLTDEEIRNAWLKAMDDYESGKSDKLPALYITAFDGTRNNAVIMLKYRAKNSLGGYVNDLQVLKYSEDYSGKNVTLRPVLNDELYLFDAMLYSSKKKELK